MDWEEESEEQDDGCFAGRTKSGLFSWLACSVDAPGLPPGTHEFIASTGVVDRHGDSLDQQTWKLAQFRQNPVILYEHYVPVIGSGKVKIADTGEGKHLRLQIKFDTDPSNPIGVLAAHQHANGFRKAVSVGFAPGERKYRTELDPTDPLYVDPKSVPWRGAGGMVYRHNTLLETSSVAVPANPEALQMGLDLMRAEDQEGAFTRFLGETVDKRTKEFMIGAIRNDPEVRRAIQAFTLPGDPPPPSFKLY